ncbi:hypothetical protein Holit_02556 [Hollandina sp. SP2]
MRHRDLIGEYYAKSSVNVEIGNHYAKNIALAIETSPNPCAYWMSPTTAGDTGTPNVVMHISVPLQRPYWNPAIQIPQEYADPALKSIDHIAMFVGNKVFYFSHADVQKFSRRDKDGYALFYLPGIFYERSLVFRNWSNYYGDLNFGIKALSAFFLYPARYAFPWFFLILLLFLNKKALGDFYSGVLRNKKTAAKILLVLIVAAAFVLRWNGYVRHSGWTDEIYSAVRAGNPHLPFISTFGDTGNPPFYFILLRYWFKLFGWTESSGTMLSVLLGTGAVFTLYALVKPFMGKKTALCAALFTALSGFAIGYSQEMRAYILKMFLAPLVSLAFLNLLKNMSVKNIILYLVPSVCMVNSHYYGILFIMANYLFFIAFMACRHAWDWKKFIIFTAVNGFLALIFLPFLLYMLLYQRYNFIRDFRPSIGHGFLVGVLVVFGVSFFTLRKPIMDKIKDTGILEKGQLVFMAYILLVPAFIFTLSFGISFFRPMISFRYLWPINAPFFFTLAAVFIYCVRSQKKFAFAAPLLVYMFAAGLNGIIPDIPSGGIEGYQEARAYIAADAAAHPDRKAVMLENAPQNAAYYGFEVLPAYSAEEPWDVLYGMNDIFHLHEMEMYENMDRKNINSDTMLKIYFDYDYPRGDGGVIFKKQR